MPDFEAPSKRERIKAVLNRLMKIGWIRTTVIHDNLDTLDIEWTEKGRERARQVIQIVNELHGGADDLMALAVICRSHPP
jgi:hypothetical protein